MGAKLSMVASALTVVVEDVPDVLEAVLEAREAHGDAVHRPERLRPRLGPLPQRLRHLVVQLLLHPPVLYRGGEPRRRATHLFGERSQPQT